MESTALAVFFVGVSIVKNYIYHEIVNNIIDKYKKYSRIDL